MFPISDGAPAKRFPLVKGPDAVLARTIRVTEIEKLIRIHMHAPEPPTGAHPEGLREHFTTRVDPSKGIA